MPRISGIEIVQRAEQPILSIRKRIPPQEIPSQTGRCFGKLTEYIDSLGDHLADIPFVGYHNIGTEHFEVEFGFPLAEALPPLNEIKSSVLPKGLYIFCYYRGPYDKLEPVYREMEQVIKTEGHAPSGTIYEYYCNGPEFPTKDLLTRVMMPLRD